MKEHLITDPDMCDARDLDLDEACRDWPLAMKLWASTGRSIGAIIEYGTRPAVTLHITTMSGVDWWYDCCTNSWQVSN